MSPTVIALVVAAAAAHAAWNLAAKRAGDGGPALVWLSTVASTVLYAPLAIGVVVVTRPPFDLVTVGAIAVSAMLHTVYFTLLQRGYAVGDLSVVYPLARGTGPLLSVLFAVLVFHERPGVLGVLGALTVVLGIMIVSGGGNRSGISTPTSDGDVQPLGPDGSRVSEIRRFAGVGYGLVTGLAIASYTIWDAHAVAVLAITPVLYGWGEHMARGVLLTPYACRRWSRVLGVWRAHRSEVLAIGLLSPMSYLLVLVAFTMAPVSLVAPARELSIVIATLFGWALLREPQAARRLVGAAVMLGGVVALAAT